MKCNLEVRKGKVNPAFNELRLEDMGRGEWMYRFTMPTSALVGGELHAPAALPSDKDTRVPIV
jgi:hypothetical protein